MLKHTKIIVIANHFSTFSFLSLEGRCVLTLMHCLGYGGLSSPILQTMRQRVAYNVYI
jgi:hypothetical protein